MGNHEACADRRNISRSFLPFEVSCDEFAGPDVQERTLIRLKTEITGINPLHVNQWPEVEGEAIQDVVIWEPAVAVVAPVSAPGVTDEQRSFCLGLTLKVCYKVRRSDVSRSEGQRYFQNKRHLTNFQVGDAFQIVFVEDATTVDEEWIFHQRAYFLPVRHTVFLPFCYMEEHIGIPDGIINI